VQTVRERDKGNDMEEGENIFCQVAPGIIKSASLFCFTTTLRHPSGPIVRQDYLKEQLREIGSEEIKK
jgi:hypothetical protein